MGLTSKNFTASLKPVSKLKADLLVVILAGDKKIGVSDNAKIAYWINDAAARFADKTYKRPFFTALGDDADTKFLLVTSTALVKYYDNSDAVRIAASGVSAYIKDYGCKSVAVLLNGADGAEFIGPVVEGLTIGDYSFDRYKNEKSKNDVAVEIVVDKSRKKHIETALSHAGMTADCVNLARDITNEPSHALTPAIMADLAQEIAKEFGLKCSVLKEDQLKKQGYNCLIAIGQGSPNPPRLITLEYKPKKAGSNTHVALVGKGVTFDTGGIMIKAAAEMWHMKSDMGGAAAVLYAMQAIAQMQPSIRFTGIIAAAENCTDGNAINPGTIIKAKNGKHIHVDNTDAEGRIVLTDGFAKAGEMEATHIIDIATLTGGVMIALGKGIGGIWGTDALTQHVIACGQAVGEKFWRMPLPPEYRERLNIYAADINNSAGRPGNPVNAALFLQEFLPEGVQWAHLDIAGVAFQMNKWKYYQCDGANGFGLRTFVEIALNAEKLPTA